MLRLGKFVFHFVKGLLITIIIVTSPAEVVSTVDVAVVNVAHDRRVQLSLTCAAAQTCHVPSAVDRRQVVPVGYCYTTSGTRDVITA